MASIFLRTIIVYILLSLSMKIMGKRQIGELDVSDLISTLLISELAAMPIDDPDIPLLNAVIPILFIVSLEVIISFAKNKLNKLKSYLEGQPAFVIFKGKLLQETLRENRISINELLSEMRIFGVGDIRDLDYCILEQNGKLSFIKKQNSGDRLSHPVIIDGAFNKSEIRLLEMTENDIIKLLGDTLPDSVFLMTLDDNSSSNIIIKEEI